MCGSTLLLKYSLSGFQQSLEVDWACPKMSLECIFCLALHDWHKLGPTLQILSALLLSFVQLENLADVLGTRFWHIACPFLLTETVTLPVSTFRFLTPKKFLCPSVEALCPSPPLRFLGFWPLLRKANCPEGNTATSHPHFPGQLWAALSSPWLYLTKSRLLLHYLQTITATYFILAPERGGC